MLILLSFSKSQKWIRINPHPNQNNQLVEWGLVRYHQTSQESFVMIIQNSNHWSIEWFGWWWKVKIYTVTVPAIVLPIIFCSQVAFLQQRELCGLLRKDWDLTVLWLIGDKNTTCDVDAHYLVDNYAWYPILHLKARSNPHKKPWSYSNSWSRINSCSDCRMKPFFERRLKTSGALFTWETIHCERVMYRFLVNLHQICIYSSSSLRYERDLVGNNVCSQRRRDRGKGRLAT